ncbi:MAG: MerR family transcriptional regulator [Acidobacteria bacterium]|nr:MerR family transcriptional regulator [Acidobacteriota bacterium]MCA1602098.1 MerR family transcriptional regulator [Acidobacteriota bacterium]
MSHSGVAIPEKLFFKIGEVCELAGVQAHVLRYWESEFSMLAPQKNRAGQRVYRKRDVEMALRIKELLYEDQYTIAGAKKRLANDLRGGKIKTGTGEGGEGYASSALANEKSSTQRLSKVANARLASSDGLKTAEDRNALRRLATELRELLSMLEKESQASTPSKK